MSDLVVGEKVLLVRSMGPIPVLYEAQYSPDFERFEYSFDEPDCYMLHGHVKFKKPVRVIDPVSLALGAKDE